MPPPALLPRCGRVVEEPPLLVRRGERIVRRLEDMGFAGPPRGIYPFVGSILGGGGLAIGPGVRESYGDTGELTGHAAISIRSYKTVAAGVKLPTIARRVNVATRAQWIDWFADKDLSFAPVNNLREAFDDLHAQARSMRVEDARGHEHIGIPIKFAAEPGRAHLQVPWFGEHTDEILSSLGYEAAAIEQLSQSGAVVCGGAPAPIA